MKFIIDIPEEAYKLLKNEGVDWLGAEHILNAVANATLLPKGHRFIDADEILNHAFIRDDEEGDIFVQKYYCIKKEIVDNALVLFDTLEDKEQECLI